VDDGDPNFEARSMAQHVVRICWNTQGINLIILISVEVSWILKL
jgi:hypothetical protein